MRDDDGFQVRPGRIRSRGARARTFVAQVLQAAVKAGYLPRRGLRAGRPPRGAGRSAAIAISLRSPARRVVIKARIVRHSGARYRAAPLGAHLRYLQREGVDRAGVPGQLFDAEGDADGRGFAERCKDDRHHFRFIVSPEDAAQLESMRDFTRDLMRRAEADLGSRLDWVAVEHWNTAHPHVHVLVRGVDETGADLVIDPGYMMRGLRGRAEALVTLELGPRSAREIAAGLERETVAPRWTRLDELLSAESPGRVLDLRPGAGARDPGLRPLLIARAETLARLGLATAAGVGVWRLDPERRERLHALAERDDIIAGLHRAAGRERALAELAPFAEQTAVPILGRVAARGLHDELAGRAFLVVDGLDGRLHHLRLPDLGAAGDTPVGGIVEARPDPAGVRVVHRSDLSVAGQVTAEGATWLDRQLLASRPEPLSDAGFAAEVRDALRARARRLVEMGLGRESGGGRFTFAKDVLGQLRRQELAAAGARLARETGLAYRPADGDPIVRGRYARRLDLASGRFAMVEDGLGFRLAPWARVLDRRLGQEVRGQVTPTGVDWDLGRARGRGR